MAPPLQLEIAARNTALAELTKTKAAVVELSNVAQSKIGGVQGLGGALQRLERTEPTRAMRELRTVIDEMVASATGLDPRIARVASNFSQLFGGSLVVAGAAAVASEVKQILDFTNSLDSNLAAVNAKFAAMVPLAQQLGQVSNLSAVLGTDTSALDEQFLPKQPGVFARFAARIGDFLSSSGTGDISQAFQTETQSALTTVSLMRQRQLDAFHDQENQRRQAETNAVMTATLALDKARLGATATASELDRLAHRQDELRLSTMHLTDEHKRAILAFDDEARAVVRRNEDSARALAAMGVTSQTLPLYESIGIRIALAIGQGARVVMLGHMAGDFSAPTGDVFSQVANFNAPAVPDYLKGDIATFGQKAGDKAGLAIARTVAASLPSLISAVSRGDFGGFLSGAGAGIEGLSNLKGFSAAGPIGLVASLLGGLASLFSSGDAKVKIESVSDQAAQQMRSFSGTPNSVQVFLVDVNGNVKQTMWAQQHEARKDGVTRLPVPIAA